MRRAASALALCLALGLADCGPPADRCAAIGGHDAIVVTLLFGLAVPGRGPVTDDEWAAFLRDTVTPAFPDGLTVQEGGGQWRDPATGRISREPSRTILIATDDDPSLAGRLFAVAADYKARFRQRSVGILAVPACAAF